MRRPPVGRGCAVASTCASQAAGSSSPSTISGGDPVLTEDELKVVRKEDATGQATAYVHAVHALSALVRRRGVDALIVLVALGSVLEVALREQARLPETSRLLAVPAVALIVLALLGRHWNGFAAGAALWLLAAGVSLVDGRLVVSSTFVQIAGLGAAYLVGNARELRQACAGLALVVTCSVIIVAADPRRGATEFIYVPALFTVAWVAGFVLRQRTVQGEAALARAARLESEQEEHAHRAIADERARIARELHDVVGHCVSVMTVQASAVRRVLAPEQRQEREALMAVERVGREALGEMRRLVGFLRESSAAPDLAPRPSLRDLAGLVSHARAGGLNVDLDVGGDPLELPASIDLTAYRIVQEGLTNAIRHAHASTARVRIRYDAGTLDIEVCDDGIGVLGNVHSGGHLGGHSGGHSGGHGLLGMRERVDVFGGRFEAGPRVEGGFRLSARLPVPV